MTVHGSGSREGGGAPSGPTLRLAVAASMLLAAAVLVPSVLEAQLASAAAARAMVRTAPRVHVECELGVPCAQGVLRAEINWVDWMDEPDGAEVHVLVSGVNGGEDPAVQGYTLDFAGQGRFAHLSDELRFAAAPEDDPAAIQGGLSQTLRMGLMRYAVEAGLGQDMVLGFNPSVPLAELADPLGGTASAGPATVSTASVYDPWDFWTFRAGLSGNVDIQESRQNYRLNPSLSADRITEDWKLQFSASHNVNRETIELTNRTVRNDRDSWNLSALIVRSLGGHMSTGVDVEARNSVQNNQRSRITVAPGIEWNYYPYAESTRRQLLAHYAVGVQLSNYAEETIFGVTSETNPIHKIGIQYRQSEGWGNAGISADAFQYLHARGLYSVGLSGNLSFRVVRGLDLNLNASSSWIRNEIHIPAGDLSEEDVLLGRQALPTGYNYQFSVGLGYRWGSAFSNIVNARFPSASMGGGPPGGFGGPGGGGGR